MQSNPLSAGQRSPCSSASVSYQQHQLSEQKRE
jgi:hypothetical protein